MGGREKPEGVTENWGECWEVTEYKMSTAIKKGRRKKKPPTGRKGA